MREKKNKYKEQIAKLEAEKAELKNEYLKALADAQNTKKRLQKNANYDMCIDDMLFNMWEQVV